MFTLSLLTGDNIGPVLFSIAHLSLLKFINELMQAVIKKELMGARKTGGMDNIKVCVQKTVRKQTNQTQVTSEFHISQAY